MEIFIFDTHWRLSTITAPYKFTQGHSSEGCLFSSEKTCDVECLKPIFGVQNVWKKISEGGADAYEGPENKYADQNRSKDSVCIFMSIK